MSLISRFTMSDAQWRRFHIYRYFQTTLRDLKCDACTQYGMLYIYNNKGFCSKCIDLAVANRTGFMIQDGGIDGDFNYDKRNFGTPKRKNGSVSGGGNRAS